MIFYRECISHLSSLISWNKKMLEVSENVKHITVTSRDSKLQIFKVWPGQDLNPGLLCESLNIMKLTHERVPDSNPGQAEL